MIELLIVDDHPLVIGGISAMLQDVENIRIVGFCKTANEALDVLKRQEPHVILLDINLPDINGLELCTIIRAAHRKTKIIALTSANEAGLITQMLKQGANGYLLKNMERDELLDAIDAVMNGRIFLSKAANDRVLEQFSNVPNAVNQAPVITRREKEVLKLLYAGLNGPQIGEKLFLSPFTIETHRKNMMQKFKVTNTQLLLKAARELRLLDEI